MCPIHKKGDRTECSNYRPITLLNIAHKIFAILINNRLSEIVQKKLSDVQMGFRPDRSTVDNIFIIRQIYKKCYECNIELHNVFIDYTHAFNSIDLNKALESLKHYDVPIKLISLIALTLAATKAIAKVHSEYSNKFEVHRGVKQGDPLSATLFSIAIDAIIRKLDARGNISTRLKQCAAYADDNLITARTK
jgi:retron-type reverse transcriptase